MPRSVVVFRAEHGGNLEYPFKHRYQRLLVKLGALRKINDFAEVVELENVRAAFRAGKIDFRGVDFSEVLTLQIFAETSLYAFLQFENRAFLGVAQGDGAVVKIY